jgi:hypothetical protein
MADQIFLLRVKPSPATINDPGAYEFFAGYNAPLKKFLMFISRGMSYNEDAPHDTMILEAVAVGGSWKLVEYMPAFGPNAYFVSMPGSHYSMSLHEVPLLPRTAEPRRVQHQPNGS